MNVCQLIETSEGERLTFECPGCGCLHGVPVDGSRGWSWNGDFERPTIRPSILVKGTEPPTDEQCARILAGEVVPPRDTVCHSFVTAGKIQFLSDSTHDLRARCVRLKEL